MILGRGAMHGLAMTAVAIAATAAMSGAGVPRGLAQQADGNQATQPLPNAAPGSGYAIELRFTDLPGSLAELKTHALYEVTTRDCVPVDHKAAVGGIKLPPQHKLDLELARRQDGVFTTQVFTDAFADSDMFGLGACHWSLQSFTVRFDSAATRFIGGAAPDELEAASPVLQHYLVADFFAKPAASDYVFGEKPDHYLKSLGAQFVLTIKATRIERTPP
jgi:hypothetical protein